MRERGGTPWQLVRSAFRCHARTAARALGAAAVAWLLVDVPAWAHHAAAQGLFERSRLTGDWGGRRDWLAEHGLELELVYTADVFSNADGGLRRRTVYLDNLDFTLNCHLDELFHLPLGTLFLYGLSNQGDNPSADVGDVQGVDNIEAPNAVKLYEAWWQSVLFEERLSVLIGLYDLNSEFDVSESANVLINSSFGIGPAFALSGINGPSIFPTTSLGLRVKVSPFEHLIMQSAILDGVPGDPHNPTETEIKLGTDDGLLIAAEAAFVWPRADETQEPSLERIRQRRIGRGWGSLPYAFKLAVGTWFYTARLPVVEQAKAQGEERMEHGDPGVYVLADVDVYREAPSSAQGLSAFVQLGLADPDVEQLQGYTGGGLVYTGLIPGRDADQLGFGVAAAHNGSPFRRAQEAAGTAPAEGEVALEWTYRGALTPWLALQPDIQYVIHPGGFAGRANALVLGVRSEIDF